MSESPSNVVDWHLLTGEYPDQPGGVSDYTRSIACGLAAAGAVVHVWAPAFAGTSPFDPGVTVHRLPGLFNVRAFHTLSAALKESLRPVRLFVQYVPHSFGWKGMNVALARWLASQQHLWVLFHEVAFPRQTGQPFTHRLLASIQNRMARWVARNAERIFVSVPTWVERLEPLTPVMDRVSWLPIPSAIPTTVDAEAVARWRKQLQVPLQASLIGHFGTYGAPIIELLTPLVVESLRLRPDVHFVFTGRSSEIYASSFSGWEGRIHATGGLPADKLGECLCACDLLVQPFPDGLSCRRTSAMAGLALGVPIVTNLGPISEPLWRTNGVVAVGDPARPVEFAEIVSRLLGDEHSRHEMSRRSKHLYRDEFSLEHTIDVLLERRPARPFPMAHS